MPPATFFSRGGGVEGIGGGGGAAGRNLSDELAPGA